MWFVFTVKIKSHLNYATTSFVPSFSLHGSVLILNKTNWKNLDLFIFFSEKWIRIEIIRKN